MGKFTTQFILKKDRKPEKYNYPVLTQHSYNVDNKSAKAKFELNFTAMKQMEFKPNIPNVNRINWGRDNETKQPLLANTGGVVTDKLSEITSENIFYNQKFLDELVRSFSIDPLQIHEFELSLYPEDSFMIATLKLIEEEVFIDTFNQMVQQEIGKQEEVKFEQF